MKIHAKVNGKVLGQLALGCLSAVPLTLPSQAGEWQQFSSMNETRQYPGLARLADGRILAVTGHPLQGKSLASAEIYDPATNRWTPTGSLSVPRNGVQPGGLIMLPNGKVLIAGSGSGSRSVHEAELFDPSTNTWSETGPMSVPRCVHTSTQLKDGRVLVAGGIDWTTNEVRASTEIFDHASGKWTPAGAMSTPRWNHQAVRMDDGRILVMGGAHSDSEEGNVLASAEIFDPENGKWESTSPMRDARRALGSVLLKDGRVLVAGGKAAKNTPLSATEIYDPQTRQWTAAQPLAQARWGPSITLLDGGDVLVVAGMPGRFGRSKSAERFDPASGKWEDAGELKTQRNGHRAIKLDNDQVLIVGGFSGFQYLSSCELYVP